MASAKTRRTPLRLSLYLQMEFEKRLGACREAWEQTHDPVAIAVGLTVAVEVYRQLPPPWLVQAAAESLMHARTAADKRRYREDQEHWKRWAMVKRLRLRPIQGGGRLRRMKGLSKAAAVEQTAEALKVGVPTVELSCKIVQRRVKKGGASRYLIWTKTD